MQPSFLRGKERGREVSIALKLLLLVQRGFLIHLVNGKDGFNRPQALTISATSFYSCSYAHFQDVSIALKLLLLVQLSIITGFVKYSFSFNRPQALTISATSITIRYGNLR